MDRAAWLAEVSLGCKRALKYFNDCEAQLKSDCCDTYRFESVFREIERDHRILIRRTSKLGRYKDADYEEFLSFQIDLYEKIREVRDKLGELAKAVREQSE
jgi:predicted  nucleic acid-binding Zn-ribbon protein